MNVIILLVVLTVGSIIVTIVDSLLGIKMDEAFGQLPAIIHNVTMMLYGAASIPAIIKTTT